VYTDRKLRALQRLAERTEGADLDRVLAMIAERRRELERELDPASELWDLPYAESEDKLWRPGSRRFTPASREAVPVKVRRPGERGYRIVGVRRGGADPA
jgi:hypothetical protein